MPVVFHISNSDRNTLAAGITDDIEGGDIVSMRKQTGILDTERFVLVGHECSLPSIVCYVERQYLEFTASAVAHFLHCRQVRVKVGYLFDAHGCTLSQTSIGIG